MGQFIHCVGMVTTRFLRPFAIIWKASYVFIDVMRECLSCILQRTRNRFTAKIGTAGRRVAGYVDDFTSTGPCVRSNECINLFPIRGRQATYRRCWCSQLANDSRYFRWHLLCVQRVRVNATTTLTARLEKFSRDNCGGIYFINHYCYFF